jgi:hypothetical protein
LQSDGGPPYQMLQKRLRQSETEIKAEEVQSKRAFNPY